MSVSLQPYRERARAHQRDIELGKRPKRKRFDPDRIFLNRGAAALFLNISVAQLVELVRPSVQLGPRSPRWAVDDLETLDRDVLGSRVYVIARLTTNEVKIGISNSPLKRLRALQCASGDPLTLLCTIPGGVETEVELHERFKAHRKLGEWFHLAPEIQVWVEGVAK